MRSQMVIKCMEKTKTGRSGLGMVFIFSGMVFSLSRRKNKHNGFGEGILWPDKSKQR